MGFNFQIQESYEELVEHPHREEIIALLGDDFSDDLLDSMSNDGKRVTMKQLENKLDYNVDSLLTDEKLIFFLGDQPVGYIKIEPEEDNSINLTVLMTSNNNNPVCEIVLPEFLDMSLDNKHKIIGKKLPYLGTTMLKILVEKFCSKKEIKFINIVSSEGAEGFYEKSLTFLQSEKIIGYYEQDENNFIIYL